MSTVKLNNGDFTTSKGEFVSFVSKATGRDAFGSHAGNGCSDMHAVFFTQAIEKDNSPITAKDLASAMLAYAQSKGRDNTRGAVACHLRTLQLRSLIEQSIRGMYRLTQAGIDKMNEFYGFTGDSSVSVVTPKSPKTGKAAKIKKDKTITV